jgi:hypothetical protein
MSSPVMIGSWLVVGGVLAPLVGGYAAARIAPDAKLLHGVLSTSLWLVFAVLLRHLGAPTTRMFRVGSTSCRRTGRRCPRWPARTSASGAPCLPLL